MSGAEWFSAFSDIAGLFQQQNAFSKARNDAAMDRQMQYEFAQNGVQWRVNDAREAGIHPLAALGANTHASRPINVGGGTGPNLGQTIFGGLAELARIEAMNKEADADYILKSAQAAAISKDLQNQGPKDMWVQMKDNNPDSPTYGQLVWVPDPNSNWAEQMESGAGFWGGMYSNASTQTKKQGAKAKKYMKEHDIHPIDALPIPGVKVMRRLFQQLLKQAKD